MSSRRSFLESLGLISLGGIGGYIASEIELLELIQQQQAEDQPQDTENQPQGTPNDSTKQELSVPFTATFENGLNGWTVNQRFRSGEDRAPSDPNAGEGGYSSEYGGSVRLHVGGGQSTIGVARTVSGLTQGTEISVSYHVEASSPQPGSIGVALFAPDGDDMTDNDGYYIASNTNEVSPGSNTISASLSRDYPDGTQLRVVADVWPGEFTAFVRQVRVQ